MWFLGVDLSSSPERPSAVAVLDEQPGLVYLGAFAADEALASLAHGYAPVLVGIDAPLGLPRGLCCLDESCSCRPLGDYRGRACEQALASRGIGCFFTTKRSIIRAMVYRAMALARLLERDGHSVIEVYPYATRRVLFGPGQPRKTRAEGLALIQARLAGLVRGVDGLRMDHHGADALLAAYTACLHQAGRTELLGVPEEGLVAIPRF